MKITEIYKYYTIELSYHLDSNNGKEKDIIHLTINGNYIGVKDFNNTKEEIGILIVNIKNKIDQLNELGFK